MADDKKKSKELEAAETHKANAEAQAFLTEAEHNKARTRRAIAQAELEELNLIKARIEADKISRSREKELAVDDENHLYRFSGEVSGNSVERCIKKLTEWHRLSPKCDIELVFSSPGGAIIDGFELFDYIQYLRNNDHHITTGTLGMAASMAGILLQAGDTRWIGQQAWLMIHRAAFGAYGKTFEIEDEVKFVKRVEERILDIFTSRSELTRNKIKRNWERKDWWISAEEAVDLKLVDEIRAILPEHQNNKKKRKKK